MASFTCCATRVRSPSGGKTAPWQWLMSSRHSRCVVFFYIADVVVLPKIIIVSISLFDWRDISPSTYYLTLFFPKRIAISQVLICCGIARTTITRLAVTNVVILQHCKPSISWLVFHPHPICTAEYLDFIKPCNVKCYL